jgi:fatty acid desaturase
MPRWTLRRVTSLFLGREPVKFAMMEISPAIHLHAAVFLGFLGPWWIVMPAVVVAPVWAYDLRVEGRIHPATLVGSLIVVSTSIHWLLK